MNKLIIVIAGCMLAGLLLAMGITQEVPIGGLRGRIVMAENGRPLSNVLVVLTRAQDEKTFTDLNWHSRTNTDGSFTITDVPAGDYEIQAEAQAHSLDSLNVSVAEGAATNVEIRLKPSDQRLQLDASQKVIAPGGSARINVSGFVGDRRALDVTVHQVSLRRIAAEGGLRSALQPISNDNSLSVLQKIGKLVWMKQEPITKRDEEGEFVQSLQVPPLSDGLYVVSCTAGKLRSSVFLNVSKIALVTKSSSKRVLCFVTDIHSGQPVPHAQLLRKNGNALRAAGETNLQGLAMLPSSGSSAQDVVIAKLGESVAACDFLSPGTNQGNDDDDSDDKVDPNTRVFTYADRPIYRPGDTVQFKAIVRRLKGEQLVLPNAGRATIKVFDPQENLLEVQHRPISSHGTLHGSYSTSKEAPPGVYRIDVLAQGGKDSYYANLAAYRKPDFSIKITPAETRYTMGDQATVNVECQYFFGGPVVGAKVQVTVNRNPAWGEDADDESDDSDNSSDDSNQEGYTGGEFVRTVEGVTDGTGKAVLRFSTRPESDEEDDSSEPAQPKLALYDYNYSLQASVEESDSKSFEGSGSFFVSRGDFRLEATTDPFIASPGQKASLLLTTVSFDKVPKPVAGRQLSVAIGDEIYAHNTVVFEPMQTVQAVTDAQGKAVVPLTIGHQKNIRFRISTTDDRRRLIQAETYLYVEGSPVDTMAQDSKLTVKLDRRKYQAGDVAKVLVATNRPGGQALLTIQAEDIKTYRLVDLAAGSSIVHIPVDPSMAPNVFVSACYVFKRTFAETSRKLSSSRPDRKLTISLIPSTTKALPGSTVSIRVKTTDQYGHGVPADVSLGVVDESIYAIRKDTTDVASSMYPERQDLVNTAYSFPDIYLDGGDKGGGNIAVRRKFQDTAVWSPDVETDSDGNAVCLVPLPDNLTSWRATAVGATDATAVGMATTNIRASKPLMVRLLTPQFLVAKDSQQMNASVTNDSGAALDVDFRIKATGLQLADTTPKRLHLEQSQTLDIPLDVQAPDVSGAGDLVAEVRAEQGPTDAVDGTFPVLPHGRLMVDHSSGILGPNTRIELNALPNRDKVSGGLDVVVTPGVASAMLESIDQLVKFPYGCVEQTLSRFLPAILVTNALKGTSFDKPELDRRASKIAVDGFERLIKMQHSDGGWGWWEYDESSPFMTAWVLDGLAQARAIGYAPPGNLNLENALKWSSARLTKPEKNDDPRDLLFLAYALADNGNLELPKAKLNTLDLRKADAGDLAVAAMLAKMVGESDVLEACVSRLHDLIDRDQYFNGKDDFWTASENVALALSALTRLDPKDPGIPALLKRLNEARGCYGWESTRESALALESLCAYLKANPQTVEPSEVTISLNGRKLRTVHVVPGEADVPDLRLSVPLSSLSDGKNLLTFAAKGGAPYYSTELRQYDVEDPMPLVLQESDVHVTRSYHRLEPKKMEDGTMELQPEATPVSSVRNGDIIRCVIKVQCSHPVSYVMVEDPIPSNCQVTDREEVDDDSDWGNWWASIVIRDDRVSLFADQLPAGTHELTYTMRAQGPGASDALPTYLEDMYRPSISTSGTDTPLRVNP